MFMLINVIKLWPLVQVHNNHCHCQQHFIVTQRHLSVCVCIIYVYGCTKTSEMSRGDRDLSAYKA